MLKAKVTDKMIDYCCGSINEISHFLKVHSYARTISVLENVDSKTLLTIELAAIVHDIACPLCRKKYGSVAGNLQELESPALLAPFFDEFDIDEDMKSRIVWLVSHHHTVTDVDSIDHQILLEADFLVNAEKLADNRQAILDFRSKVFKTESGKRLLDSIHLNGK